MENQNFNFIKENIFYSNLKINTEWKKKSSKVKLKGFLCKIHLADWPDFKIAWMNGKLWENILPVSSDYCSFIYLNNAWILICLFNSC